MGKARDRPTTGRAIASVAPMRPDRQQGKECAMVGGIPASVKESGDPGALKEFLSHYPAAGSRLLPSEVMNIDPSPGQDDFVTMPNR